MVENASTSSQAFHLPSALTAGRIGSNIKSWRIESDISETSLASCLDVSVETIRRAEMGEQSFSAEQIGAICQAYDVEPSRFLSNII